MNPHEHLPPDPLTRAEVTAAAGATHTSNIDCRGFALVAVATPAALTSTTGALQTSLDGGLTWLPVYDREGSAITLALAASRYIALSPAEVAGLGLARLSLGTAEAAERTITFVVRKLS